MAVSVLSATAGKEQRLAADTNAASENLLFSLLIRLNCLKIAAGCLLNLSILWQHCGNGAGPGNLHVFLQSFGV